MSDYRQRLGRHGEELAAEYLEGAGYTIIERNWRCRAGEVDIVAQDGETLALVEVRVKRSHRFGSPEESITPRKREVLAACGQYWVAESRWTGPWRIDLVAIEMPRAGLPASINLIRNAVEG